MSPGACYKLDDGGNVPQNLKVSKTLLQAFINSCHGAGAARERSRLPRAVPSGDRRCGLHRKCVQKMRAQLRGAHPA